MKSRLPIALALPLLAGACSFQYAANCMNGHVSPNYGTVAALPGGGFEVTGSGVRQTPLEVSQTAAPLRPGTAGDPADDYPKPKQRGFACRPVEAQ